ncbi:conjugal transfer protein TraI [Amycolatopsis aidingensis]|uniref:conjugal transfer protein TraI n=1 Tax=Amycolatopsis aidingensis TaxID=2842453 RepID=UPI001C0DCD34|nr:conjugal transfer protein TraI [Amycolatopsis aidingensis]
MSTGIEFVDGPGDDEVARGMAALERHLADTAPAAAAPPPVSKRVRQRRAEHAEARQLVELDTDETPFLVETDRLRARRRRVREAGQLWRLEQDPMVLAYRDSRMRRLLVTVALVALGLALAWSTAGVQAFAAEGAQPWTPRWLFAWLVEPFCSLALLTVVGARAYLAVRHRPLNDRAVRRAEWVFLGLTLAMNAWPYLPGIAEVFSVSALVLHLLGPIVAVTVVTCLPRILAAFADLAPAPTPAAAVESAGVTGSTPATGDAVEALDRAGDQHESTPDPGPERGRIPERSTRSLADLRALLRDSIAAGRVDPSSAESIRKTLRCSVKRARQLRDEHQGGRK